MSRKAPELTQIAGAVQDGGGYTLATRAGKRERICHTGPICLSNCSDAVQSGLTALERMPSIFAVSSTLFLDHAMKKTIR